MPDFLDASGGDLLPHMEVENRTSGFFDCVLTYIYIYTHTVYIYIYSQVNTYATYVTYIYTNMKNDTCALFFWHIYEKGSTKTCPFPFFACQLSHLTGVDPFASPPPRRGGHKLGW